MLFKILHGDDAYISLDIVPFHEGYCYVTYGGNMYVDMNTGTASEPNNQRIQLNAANAQTLCGMTLEEIKASILNDSLKEDRVSEMIEDALADIPADDAIIDVETLPIENINENTLYRHKVEKSISDYDITLIDRSMEIKNGEKVHISEDGADYVVTCYFYIVDTLPEIGNKTIGNNFHEYIQLSDMKSYTYTWEWTQQRPVFTSRAEAEASGETSYFILKGSGDVVYHTKKSKCTNVYLQALGDQDMNGELSWEIVDELPQEGEPAIDTTSSKLKSYFVSREKKAYGYITSELAEMSDGLFTVGWVDGFQLLTFFFDTAFEPGTITIGGVYSSDNIPEIDSYKMYIIYTIEEGDPIYELSYCKDGDWNHIGRNFIDVEELPYKDIREDAFYRVQKPGEPIVKLYHYKDGWHEIIDTVAIDKRIDERIDDAINKALEGEY